MKSKMVSVLCLAVLGLGTVTPAAARTNPDEAFFDAVLGRPIGLAATVVGSAAFVVSLPFSAASGSIKPTADALVGKPGRFTFTRPLGDFSYPYYHHHRTPTAKKQSKPATAHRAQATGHTGSF